MAKRVRIFVDFWNFQIEWNRRSKGAKCNWASLPKVLVDSARQKLPNMDDLEFEEIRVYASVAPQGDAPLRGWLDNFLDRMPGFHVEVRERIRKTVELHCRSCSKITNACTCGTAYTKTEEKGIDTAIATDLLSLACLGGWL